MSTYSALKAEIRSDRRDPTTVFGEVDFCGLRVGGQANPMFRMS